MRVGSDKIKLSHTPRPLTRRPLTDPKRPWLDWRADEPSPFPAVVKRVKKVTTAYSLFFLLNGIGWHRVYLDKGWAAARWCGLMFVFQLVLTLFSASLDGTKFSSARYEYVLLWALYLLWLVVLVCEFKTIRPAVETYNKKHNLT